MEEPINNGLPPKKPAAKPYHDINTPFSVDERGSLAEYVIPDPDVDGMLDLALGATMLIADRRGGRLLYVACRVVGLRAISPFNPIKESLLYIENEEFDPTQPLEMLNGPHTHQPMVIRVALNREMIPDEKGTKFTTSPVQRPPSAMSKLFFPNIKSIVGDQSPSLENILNIKTQGLELGMIGFGNVPYYRKNEDGSADFLPYRWDIDNLDNKHISIIGESGAGKTVFLKNLAYQLRKYSQKNNIILTDVQGDISQLLLWDMDNIISPKDSWQEEVERDNAEQARDRFGNFQLIIPKTKEDYPQDLTSLKVLAQNRGVRVNEISLRFQDLNAPSDVEYLFRTNSEQVAMLLDDIAEILRNNIKNNTPPSITFIRKSIQRLKDKHHGKKQIPLEGKNVSYYDTTFDAAARVLNGLSKYFDLDQDALQKANNPLDCFNFDGTTVLYLDHLSTEERLMWEMQLVKWLYDNKKEMANTFVFIDEAHQIIPAKASGLVSSGVFDRLKSNFEKLAREGRKFGINLILSTQSPRDLNEIVTEMCQTKIVMKINPKNASYAFLAPELGVIANSFGQGQFWIFSPFNGTSDQVRVHSTAPPVPHEPMTTFRKKLIEKAQNES